MQAEKRKAGDGTENGKVPHEVSVSAGKLGQVAVQQEGRNMCLGVCTRRSLWKGWEENQVSGFAMIVYAHFHRYYLLLSVFRKGHLRLA